MLPSARLLGFRHPSRPIGAAFADLPIDDQPKDLWRRRPEDLLE